MEIALWIDTPALGDTIAAIPTLRKISEAYGNKPITVFTTKPFLFENHPLVKQAFKSDADKSDYMVYRTFSPLVGKQYDQHGTKIEFRYSNMDFRQFHAVSLGFTLQKHEMEMDLYIEKERELGFKDYVIIHPTHTWASRTWEREKWQALIDKLNANGIPVVAVGRDSKEVGFFNTDKPVMDINIKLGKNLLNDPDNDPAELRWMMNHRARAVVTMDSGMLHVAGTTDVNIIQLGSSIDNKLRAPYRGPEVSQDYKYFYVNGGCEVFCASNMKSNVQVHGSIQGVPPQVNCLESRPTFECHPTVDQVFDQVMKLYTVKGKVKLVHLLLEDDVDPQRQEKSIQSLSRLADMGVEYVQVWNKRWTEDPPRENFTRPDMFDKVPITPGHYGAFRAFADGAIEHFTEDVDHFIMCEGDALLTVSPLEAVDAINKAIDGIQDHDISYFSFGNRYTLEDNILQSVTREQYNDIHVVSNIIGIQMIMFPNRIREYLIDRFKFATWDGADIFLTDIFVNKFKMGMLEDPITTQASGISAIENRERSFDKKKLLYLAPHLSTGGMPEFLLKRIEALQDQDEFEVHVIEFCLYATTFTVQRDQIKELLGERFYEIAHLNSIPQEVRETMLIELIESINPDVIHIEECPESFDSFNQMSYETQQSLYADHRPWKIVETCHNIWFDPKDGKRFSPDAYAFVTPHHRLETFSEEPSDGQEILFPIIDKKKSETERRKNLEIFGFDADAEQYHLINIGLWTPGKNQGEAIAWARELEAQHPGRYQFHFIGNQASNFAHYWEPLMQDLPANCHIHGERSDVETFYHMADAVIFNSTWECNPLTVRQSLGWPIPVMARNLTQYHDMYTGALTEIVGDITEDLLRLQEMLQAPKQERNNVYTMKRFKQEHLDLYLKTVKGPVKRAQSGNYFTITWDNGPKVTSKVGRAIEVDFQIDGKSIYSHTLQGDGHWCKPAIEYFSMWKVYIDGKLVAETPTEGTVQILRFDSSSLGDTLAWVEPAVEFKNKYGLKKMYLATHKNWLFDKDYYADQGIEFITPGEWPEDAVALWASGVYMEEVGGRVWFDNKNKRDWRKIYLGDIASDAFGVGQVMKAPKLTYTGKHTQEKPYICIATASTAQAKYWNNPTGWQELINHYNNKGYDVYHISKEDTHLTGLKNAPEGLDKVYQLLQGAEVFYGISSGLSWFAWATDVPIVLISGFTPEVCEFDDERTLRIINKDVCNSCWFNHHFDRGDWNWCPEHKGSERHFECTKSISAKDVISQVEAWEQTKIEENEAIKS